MVERVVRYKEKTPLFEAFGVDAEIRSTLSRRVDLPSGGYLIFDYAEAFTVIDVNTGRFVGSRSKSSGARLEDTITKNNLEAVKEVVRQLRLRDIGGIIVIDFIDMANPKNRADGRGGAAHRARARPDEDLRRRDLAARPRRDDAPERHRRAARDPDAQVPDLRRRRHRRLRARPPRSTSSGSCARSSRRLAHAGVPRRGHRAWSPRSRSAPAASRLGERSRRDEAPLLPRAEGRGHDLDHFAVLEEGKLEDARAGGAVDEGAELELKLVEVGLHDPTRRRQGRRLRRRRRRRREARRQEGAAPRRPRARRHRVRDAARSAPHAAEAPITAEGEAEKPTRAAQRRRADRGEAERREPRRRLTPSRAGRRSPGPEAEVDGRGAEERRRTARAPARRRRRGADSRWPRPEEEAGGRRPPRAPTGAPRPSRRGAADPHPRPHARRGARGRAARGSRRAGGAGGRRGGEAQEEDAAWLARRPQPTQAGRPTGGRAGRRPERNRA